MKNIIKYTLLLLIAIVSLNISYVNAEEIDISQEETYTNPVATTVSTNNTETVTVIDSVENKDDETNDEEELPNENVTTLEVTENENPNVGIVETNNATEDENNQPNENTSIPVQKVKVITSKLDPKGNHLKGAKLQILDSNGNVVDEWITDGTKHETMLEDGEYILHEVEAPEGYDLADDKPFTVKVEVKDINADVDWQDWPCNHGDGVPLYYVEVDSVSYEVYCVNQGWEAPDGVSYNGEIVTAEDIRDYTVQTVTTGGEVYLGDGKYGKAFYETPIEKTIDVSDQTLTDQELYDKILDIIFHRYNAKLQDAFKDLQDVEIRFITEYALKNYLNAGITTLESARNANDANIRFTAEDGKTYLLFEYKYYNREYIYDPSAPKGYIISRGNGNALGNLARHWYNYHGHQKLPEVYANLFNYLINDSTNHPSDMHLYIYSTGADKDGVPYQNLLGITGYLDNIEQQEQEIKMVNKYSTEKREIKVKKVWNDNNDSKKIRPKNIKVNLYANGKIIKTVTLNKANNWSYTFKDLPVYFEGKKIKYYVDEKRITGYASEVEGNMEIGFTIKNSYRKTPPSNPKTNDNIVIYIIILITSLIGLIKISHSYIKVKTYS